MNTIEKLLVGALLVGAAWVGEKYMPVCIESQMYTQQANGTQVTKLQKAEGKCYFIMK